MPCLGISGLELSKTYCHIWNQHPWICLNAKFRKKKWKCLNLGPVPHLSILGLKFLRTIVLFKISSLEFVKHEYLTHRMNFDIRSAFSKSLESAFFEGPCPCPGPLYKVCFHKPSKVAAAKILFSRVYAIGTTCFEKCFLFHVITRNIFFFIKPYRYLIFCCFL